VQHQRLAAGAEKAQRLPIIGDIDLGERHEQIRDVARIAPLSKEDAEDRPLRKIAAAGKRIFAAQPPTARHALGGGTRRQRRRGNRFGIVAPNVDLRLLGILGDDPLMLGQHRVDPCRGGAAIGQLLDDPGKEAEPALLSAEAFGLQDAQDAGRVIFGDGLFRELPRRRGSRRALGEKRDQRPRALQHRAFFLREAAVIAR